ncbi:MAG: cupin domain-containing protein [Planctomycetaceae bacterium]|nr:cupin domain-containing protein [Planctomycetaceae bacterium]
MNRAFIALVIGTALGAGGASLSHPHKDDESVKVISAWDLKEQLDGKATRATMVEVTLEAGKAGLSHRHPGPGLVYVLEGEYELGIDDQPTKVFKAGEAFYEPAGCLHRVSKNPAAKGRTRLIAVVLHPRDVQEISVPEVGKNSQR